jgi:hypothetical protein
VKTYTLCGTCQCCVRYERDWRVDVRPLIERALCKVETGIPEGGP